MINDEERLRAASLGDRSRQALGQAWRELRSTMDENWLALVDRGAVLPAWAPSEARRPPRAGLKDWEGRACQSHYEWVLVAALAPIEDVVRSVIELRAGEKSDSLLASGSWRRMAPVEPAKIYEPISSGVPFVQLHGHAWTVAMYAAFHFSLPKYRAAQADARALSDRLGALAVEFSAEHVSSATGYHLFECGDLIEFAEHAPGETTFASKRRPRLWPEAPPDFPEELFQELGLYFPGFYAGGAGVRISMTDPSQIARADVLDLSWPPQCVGSADALDSDFNFAEIHRLCDGDEPRDESPGDVVRYEDDDELPF